MDEGTVRAATSADVDAIQWIARAGWNAAYGDFLDDETIETAMEEWYDARITRESIEHEDVGYFVAERDDEVLGYASVTTGDEPDVASLGALYVDPHHWREGVGTALLDRAEAWCRQADREVLRVQVIAENDIGVSFYEKRGYERIDERETDLFGETVRECLFRGHVA